MRNRTFRQRRLATLLTGFSLMGLLTGCVHSSGELFVDRSGSVSSNGANTIWNGKEEMSEAPPFSKRAPVTATQTFTVHRDDPLLLSTPDATELPRGIDMSWEILHDEKLVENGKLQSLLVQPVLVQLAPGDYTLTATVTATHEYRNAPRGTTPERITVPRIYIEEATR